MSRIGIGGFSMSLKIFARKNRTAILLALIFCLLLPFNNCKKFSSDSAAGLITSSSLAAPTNASTPTPSNPSQTLVLSCISRSQITAASSKISYKNVSHKLSSELKLSQWDASEDLVLIVDNECLQKNNQQDTILKYLPADFNQNKTSKSVIVLSKNSAIDLDQFNSDAMASECLEAADFNKKMQLQAVDPRLSSQTFLNSIGFSSTLMNTILNYNSGRLSTAKVAVIDTGVDITHPDLIPQFEKTSAGQIIGINAVDSSSNMTDSGFHGTHVAGLIGAAYDNGLYGTGVYGKNIKIYPVRVSNNGQSATLADMATGIIWASSQKVDLVNISMGAYSASPVLKSALSNAITNGTFFVVAAGNDGKELTSSFVVYPAMYSNELDGMITVGSFDASSTGISSFSNFSSSYVDLLSPGSDGSNGILSTIPMALSSTGMANKVTTSSGTSPIHGTSMATPVATGALAAVISMAKGKGIRITPSQLEKFIRNEGSPTRSAYASYSRSGKYLNYDYLINALINMIDSTSKPIVLDSSQLFTQRSLVGQKVTLKANLGANSKYIVNYQWYKNGVAINGAQSDTLTLSNIATGDAAEYQVEISAGSSKVVSQKIPVYVGLKSCD